LQLDAAIMANVDLLGGEKAGAVVSGLPLLSMGPKRVMMIMKGAFAHLSQRGAFYQFTYGYQSPVPRAIAERLGLKAVYVGRACANVPPAAVYRISRRGSARPTP
jgi:phospholipid N-methyltransferase